MKRVATRSLIFLVTLLIGVMVGRNYFRPATDSHSPPVIASPITNTGPELRLEVIDVIDSDVNNWNLNSGYLSMYDTVFLDDQTLLATYSYDGMRMSHDGGKSWQRLFVESGGSPRATGGFSLSGLEFLDSSSGWAFGSCLIKTTDGGQTWSNVKLPEWIDNLRVKFLNERNGYVAGRGGSCNRVTDECNTYLSVYKTTDGGKSWQKSFRTKEFDTAWDIVTIDENISIITGGGGWLYRTVDGGRTWKAVLKRDFGRVMSISRSPDGRFWLFGKNSIRHSDDFGLTWQAADNIDEKLVNHEWSSVQFTDEGLGVAVSQEAAIAVTYDGGRTWRQATSNLHVNNRIPVRDNPFDEAFGVIRLHGNHGIILGSQRDYLITINR